MRWFLSEVNLRCDYFAGFLRVVSAPVVASEITLNKTECSKQAIA